MFSAEYQLLKQLIEQANKTGSPVLRIGAGPIWSVLYLQRILSDFRCEFSHVRLEIHVHAKERLVDLLLSGQLDIAICGTDVTVESALVEKEHLANVETTIFGRLGHPLSRQSTISAADFLKFDWMAFEPREDYRASLSDMFRRDGIAPPKPSIITSSWTSGILLVESSDALTTFPIAAKAFLSKFGINALAGAPVVQAFRSGLWYRSSLMDFAAGREFRRIARRVVGGVNSSIV
ncbi:substrate-binding domain-containing protein [Martelella sp. FLE1502]